MGLLQAFETIKIVKVGPSFGERLERRIATTHHEAVITRLQSLRNQFEQDTEPEAWTALRAPAVLVLNDVCDVLKLTAEEKAQILGREGMIALRRELLSRPVLLAGVLNDRQIKALQCANREGQINLRVFRAVCPGWSNETLRQDLVNLVERGLLTKNGNTKGTFYAV